MESTEHNLTSRIIKGWKEINAERIDWRITMLKMFDYLDSSRLLGMGSEEEFVAQCELVRWAVSDFHYHSEHLLQTPDNMGDLDFDLLFGAIRMSIDSIADHAPKLLFPIYSLIRNQIINELHSDEMPNPNAIDIQYWDIGNWSRKIKPFFEPAYVDAVAVEHGLIYGLCKVALRKFVEIDDARSTNETEVALMAIASTCASLATLAGDTLKQYDHSLDI